MTAEEYRAAVNIAIEAASRCRTWSIDLRVEGHTEYTHSSSYDKPLQLLEDLVGEFPSILPHRANGGTWLDIVPFLSISHIIVRTS